MINKKILVKSIIYRILAFMFMFGLCLILTEEMYISIIAGIAEMIFKFLLYYLYEVVWKKVSNSIVIKSKDLDRGGNA